MTTSILKNLILLLLATSLIASCNQAKSDNEYQEAETTTSLSIQDIQLANGFVEGSVKTEVPVKTDIIVTFNHAVDPNEINTNTSDHNCAGEIQVSAIDFSACVVMLSNPVSQNGNRSFLVQPANELEYDTTYKIKVAKVLDLDNENASYTIYEFTTLSNETTSVAKDITVFSFLSNNNDALTEDVIATISGSSIDAVVPFGTDVTALKATFSTFGSTVEVNTVLQNRGITSNDFSRALIYSVTAADGSTKDYTVTVNVAASDAKDLTAFSFMSSNNGALDEDVTATISGTSIDATVPFGTDVTALKATFSTSGETVEVNSVVQNSGVTANDFSSAVTYTVTAADSSTKDYTVTVTEASAVAKDITAFSFLTSVNAGSANAKLDQDVTGVISGTSISVTIPNSDSDVKLQKLKVNFTTTGAIVKIGSTIQVSDITEVDFKEGPVIYTVYGSDNSTQDYTVTVTIAL
ncbi:MAG: hypothetical protein HN945_11365 [Deltaproteobacteria bacterium]|nr:hypothetical protein [Deltaproteobacteria bacterium]